MRKRMTACTAVLLFAVAITAQAASTGEARASVDPKVSIGDGSVVEGHAGARSIVFMVALDTPALSSVSVDWTTAPGTATVADFKTAHGTLVFKAGSVFKTVKVNVLPDTDTEGDETFSVDLSAPSASLSIGRARGTGTIIDDEGAAGVTASVGDMTIVEADAKFAVAMFPLTLSQPAPGTTVTFHVAPTTATGGWKGSGPLPSGVDIGDKLAAPQVVTFTTNAVQKFIKVVVASDLVHENAESFSVVIDSMNSGQVGRSGVGSVLDNDHGDRTDPDFGHSTTPVGSLLPESTLVGCAAANTRIVVTSSVHLDPACTYTKGLQINASNLTVDCRGANIDKSGSVPSNHGILIDSPATVALHDIVVRNCNVSHFGNNLRITRSGFKTLTPGSEYIDAYSNILIENNSFDQSSNSSVFIDAFVTDVTMSHNSVTGGGSVGVYLEAGSMNNTLVGNLVADNGWKEVIPGPASVVIGTSTIYYLSTGREGIAVDGSRNNVIQDNLVTDNAAGGIFVYKNCGENASTAGHWVRLYGSSGNTIRHNVVSNGPNGIWVGSRASQNQYFMDCSDTPIYDAAFNQVFLDPAPDNIVEYNRVDNMEHAIRVEADRTTVRGNWLTGADHGIVIGTKPRTELLAQPTTGSIVTGNTADGVVEPFTWVWGKGVVTFSGNVENGRTGRLAAGSLPTIDPWLFVVALL